MLAPVPCPSATVAIAALAFKNCLRVVVEFFIAFVSTDFTDYYRFHRFICANQSQSVSSVFPTYLRNIVLGRFSLKGRVAH